MGSTCNRALDVEVSHGCCRGDRGAPRAPAGRRPRPARPRGVRADDVPAERVNATFIPNGIWVGAALFYGGLAQLLAGMWEFRNRNVFGATAFSSYGAFWLSLGALRRARPASSGFAGLQTVADFDNELAWFLLAFAIFNTYMLIWSTRVNIAVMAVFLTLEITEIVLAIGYFRVAHGDSAYILHAGGWCGIVTAAAAWYASAAGVVNGMSARRVTAGRQPAVGRASLGCSRRAGDSRGVGSADVSHARARHDQHPARRAAAVPTRCGVRGTGERRTGDLRPLARRALGTGGARPRELVPPFSQLYEWKLPYAKWYLGGPLNVCYNCVDRHVEAGNGGRSPTTGKASPRVTGGRSRSPTSSGRSCRFAAGCGSSACARAPRSRSTWAWSPSWRSPCWPARASGRRTRSCSAVSPPRRWPSASTTWSARS